MLRALQSIAAILCLASLAVTPGGAQVAPAAQVPGTTARQAVEAAAAAMGGVERLRSLRNITLVGYGQDADQQGGGNITALADAPQKLIAANLKIVPVHMNVMTYDETLKMVAPGIRRVKEWCDQHLAKGDYFPGCPAFLKGQARP